MSHADERTLPGHDDVTADLGIDPTQVHATLNAILEAELSGVVRYTHYSLMISGPNRIPLVAFMDAQATESLLHAKQSGEILSGLGGHPSVRIAPIEETHQHGIYSILRESMAHEKAALELYRRLLSEVEGHSVFLEEFARGQISAEEQHQLEMSKMLRDDAPPDIA